MAKKLLKLYEADSLVITQTLNTFKQILTTMNKKNIFFNDKKEFPKVIVFICSYLYINHASKNFFKFKLLV